MGVHCHLQIEETGDSPCKGIWCCGGVGCIAHTVRIPRFLEGTLFGFSRAQRRRRPDSVLPRDIIFSSPCTSTANAVHYAALRHKRIIIIIIITSNVINIIIVERRRLSSRAWLLSDSRVFSHRVSHNIVILMYYCVLFGRRRSGTADLPR